MNDFEKIGLKHGTDKIAQHGYHRFYDFFLKHLRTRKIKMLEIGIEDRHSLDLWLEYFPRAFVYGIDKDIHSLGKRYQIFKCRQEDTEALSSLKLVDLDFIIDDGSHVPEHQLESFNYLFMNSLKPGGIYIIEDVETSYWKNGQLYSQVIQSGYKKNNSIVEIFKGAADEINKEFLPGADWIDHNEHHQIYQDVRKDIGTVTFCQNAIIIQKKDSSYKKFDGREYKWKDRSNVNKFSVYQTFFNKRTEKYLDPGFIAFDNTGKLTPFYENQILIDICLKKRNEWQYSNYVGLVSWRFREKCRLTPEEVFSRIEADNKKKQVYLLTPEKYIGKYPPVFSRQGFGQTTELCRLVDEENILPFKIQHLDTYPIISFCNFWLATPEIFSDYIKNCLLPVMKFMQQGKFKQLKGILGTPVKHNDQPHPPHAFFLEGLFQCYLHYKKFTYDFILDKNPLPRKRISERREIDFGPGNQVDDIIAQRA